MTPNLLQSLVLFVMLAGYLKLFIEMFQYQPPPRYPDLNLMEGLQ